MFLISPIVMMKIVTCTCGKHHCLRLAVPRAITDRMPTEDHGFEDKVYAFVFIAGLMAGLLIGRMIF